MHCQQVTGYRTQQSYVMAGNRRGHWMTTGHNTMTCNQPATRRLVVQTGARDVREHLLCDACAERLRRRICERSIILADDPVDGPRTAVIPLSAAEWYERFERPEAERRLAACGYRPGDRVRHQMLGAGLVLDVYPTREDVVILVDFGTPGVRRLSPAFAPMSREA
jgi:hypothetical protein